MKNKNEKTTGQTTESGAVIEQKITRPFYMLFVGFEVNRPQAFENNIQDLGVDYGHAFFFHTKNGVVLRFFSFGPTGPATPNPVESKFGIDAVNGRRPETNKYAISEKQRYFVLA